MLQTLFLSTLVHNRLYAQKDRPWILVSESDGIRVYQHDSIRTVKEFKASFDLACCIDSVEKHIIDPTSYKLWISSMDEIKLLEQETDTTDFYHMQVSVWPVFTKEGIVKTTLHKANNNKNSIYTLELDTTYTYAFTNEVVKYLYIKWDLHAISQDSTHVNMYYICNIKNYSDWVYDIIDKLYIYTLEDIIADLTSFVTKQD